MARRRRYARSRPRSRTVARRAPSLKQEMALTSQKQATTRAKDRGRISTKVYAGVGAASGLGGYLFGEYMEKKGWTIGKKTDARLVVSPISAGAGTILLIRKKTRQGLPLVAAVLLLFGGVGIFVSWLWSTYLTDMGMYHARNPDPNMLDMRQTSAGTYAYAEYDFNEV